MLTAAANDKDVVRVTTSKRARASQTQTKKINHIRLIEAAKHAAAASPKRRGLVWTDRVGLVIALAVAAISIFVWIVVLTAARTVVYDRLNQTLALWTIWAELGIALPAWLLLHAVDYANKAPAARRRLDRGHRFRFWFGAHGANSNANRH